MSNIDVFFDVDGCLINSQYNFTVPPEKLKKILSEAEGELTVHLNSNRSLSSLLKIWETIKTNGLLIYENGLGVYDPQKKELNEDESKAFPKAELLSIFGSHGVGVQFVDTDKLVTNSREFTSSEPVVFCEKTRKYTATLYPRVNQKGILQVDEDFILRVRNILESQYGLNYDITSSIGYGNILLTPKGALKSKPMRVIAGKNRIASFGDQVPDILMFRESDSGLIGCPGNAAPEVKRFVQEAGGFVCKKNYTAGCLDFLKYLYRKV